jgi:hypothetical protein
MVCPTPMTPAPSVELYDPGITLSAATFEPIDRNPTNALTAINKIAFFITCLPKLIGNKTF